MWTTGRKQNENCETRLVPVSRESCEGRRMTLVPRSTKRPPVGVVKLDADDAFIALLIAAKDASGHVIDRQTAKSILDVIRLKNSA